jgi:hypothetical protein
MLFHSLSRIAPPENDTGMRKLSSKGKGKLIYQRIQAKNDKNSFLTVKQVTRLYVCIWDKLMQVGEEILDKIGKKEQ